MLNVIFEKYTLRNTLKGNEMAHVYNELNFRLIYFLIIHYIHIIITVTSYFISHKTCIDITSKTDTHTCTVY
jgi:hypothetical protein